MPNSVRSAVPDVQRKPLSMSTAPAGKDLSEVEALRDFGRILDRALVLARLTKQEATYLTVPRGTGRRA